MIAKNDREIVLLNDRIKVIIILPGAGTNRSPKVDRSGYISSIQVKKEKIWEEQCVYPEKIIPGDETPRGICAVLESDFGGNERTYQLGVGKIDEQEEGAPPHWGSKKVTPFDKRWYFGEDSVTFRIVTGECGEYCAVEEKEVRIAGSSLFIKIRLENTGKQSFSVTERYFENYVSGKPLQEVMHKEITPGECAEWERCWDF